MESPVNVILAFLQAIYVQVTEYNKYIIGYAALTITLQLAVLWMIKKKK